MGTSVRLPARLERLVSRDASPPADCPVNAIPLDIEPLGARVHEEDAPKKLDRYA